ncbi:MAG: ATP-binding protein [Polyangiaceae bacterium]
MSVAKTFQSWHPAAAPPPASAPQVDLADSGIRRAPQAETQEQLERLDHVDRLALVGTYTAGVVHELANPTAFVLSNLTLMRSQLQALDAVLGRVERFAEGLPPAEQEALRAELGASFPAREVTQELQDMCEDSLDGVQRIGEVIEYLRTYVRLDSPVTEIALDDVVRDSLRFMRRRITERARLEVDIAQTPPLLGEPVRLSQLLMNLLANAIQAIDPGATHDHVVRIRLRTDRDRVVLTVRDTGCGMSPEVAAKAFDPFFTTKRPGEGTGLGLALCRRIAEEHGGELSFETAPGAGSEFALRLPVAR